MNNKFATLLIEGSAGLDGTHQTLDPDRVFWRGAKLSFAIYACTAIFFVSWVLGQSRESILLLDSSLFSRVFFFLNPNLFGKIFASQQGISYLSGATDLESFIFLVAYIVAIGSFVIILFLAFWLFLISYHTCIRPFHYIACLSVFPVLSFFLCTWFILKLIVFSVDKKMNRASKFQEDFSPEIFADSVSKSDPLYLSKRSVTEPFNLAQYKKNYKVFKKTNLLKNWHDWIEHYLS